jgi:TRAP-type C4-dicarboxylate transport system substrate-binding protein
MTISLTKMATTLSLSASLMMSATAGFAQETWDLPMAYSATNFQSAVGAEFATCVTAGTGGNLTLQTHPGGSLFAGGEIKRAIQTGQVNIGERLLSAHQNENALFGFDSVPFLATSFADSEKLWEAAKGPLTEVLNAQNLHLLYSVPWPAQGLYFKDEVNSVADMKGIKFRSYNSATARLAELSGMLPVQIEAAEISQAFATGVAESMVSSGATGYDRKVWESLSYFYQVDAWLPRNYMLVNLDAWNGLDESTQNVMNGCAALAEYAGDWRSIQYTDFTMTKLAENGMTVGPASEQLTAELKEIGAIMTSEWLEKTGPAGQAIIDAYKAN